MGHEGFGFTGSPVYLGIFEDQASFESALINHVSTLEFKVVSYVTYIRNYIDVYVVHATIYKNGYHRAIVREEMFYPMLNTRYLQVFTDMPRIVDSGYIHPPYLTGVAYWSYQHVNMNPVKSIYLIPGKLPNSSTKSIALPEAVGRLISIELMAFNTSTSHMFLLPAISATGQVMASLEVTDDVVTVRTFSDLSSYSTYLFVKYVPASHIGD